MAAIAYHCGKTNQRRQPGASQTKMRSEPTVDHDIRETTCLTPPPKDSRKGSRSIPQQYVYTPRTKYKHHPNGNREVDVVVGIYYVVAEVQRYSMICVENLSLILLRSIGRKTALIPTKQLAYRPDRNKMASAAVTAMLRQLVAKKKRAFFPGIRTMDFSTWPQVAGIYESPTAVTPFSHSVSQLRLNGQSTYLCSGWRRNGDQVLISRQTNSARSLATNTRHSIFTPRQPLHMCRPGDYTHPIEKNVRAGVRNSSQYLRKKLPQNIVCSLSEEAT